MYADTKVWSPFVGCGFDCTYCRPSFQAQAKRQKHRCFKCYSYIPHEHPERLDRIPSAERIFVCGSSDIAFATDEYRLEIAAAILGHATRRRRRMDTPREYYVQSKDPGKLENMLSTLPYEAVLITTLETNRDFGYEQVSRAPIPTQRWSDFRALNWPRKVITVEPLMDFDLRDFAQMIIDARPGYIWIGFNSKPKRVQLPEPSFDKVKELLGLLKKAGIPAVIKNDKGMFWDRNDA